MGLGLVSYFVWKIFKRNERDYENISDGSKRTSNRKLRYSIKEDSTSPKASIKDLLQIPTDYERNKEDLYYIKGA